MRTINENNIRDNFFNTKEADLLNDLLIDAVNRSSVGAVLQTLGYNFEDVKKAQELFKQAYIG